MYSLLSASVLAVDLVRAPGGARAAEVLLGALVLDTAAVPVRDVVDLPLAEARSRARLATASTGRLDSVLTGVTGLFREPGPDGLPTAGELRVAADLLAGTTLGRAEDLVALLHAQVLPDRADLAAAAADAVTAALAVDALDPGDAERLAARWREVVGPLPAAAHPVGLPGARGVGQVLDRCAALDPDDLAALDRAHHRGPAGAGLVWSTAMHEACVVALDSGLVRPLAGVQVAAALAVAAAGQGRRVTRVGAMPAVVGHLQAVALGPLLPPATAGLLSAAWVAVAG